MIKLHAIKGLAMWYMHRPTRIKGYIARNKKNEERIRRKDSITVVFFASNVSMWHYQNLYEEMLKHKRFKPIIVISPLNAYAHEQKVECVKALRLYFEKRGINYIDYDIDNMKGFDVKGILKPDVLFYPQPYYTVMCKEHRYYRFKKSLLAYYPYFFHRTKLPFEYNEDFHNRAWRLYYETDFQKKDAKEIAAIGDLNVRVVGYPNADYYNNHIIEDPWKTMSNPHKRVIWAPHFTLDGNGWINSSNFIWMADFMLNIAHQYSEIIQFAFKPHPRLLSELYKHPEWGKERADAYYKNWRNMNNGQLVDGAYIDLFMTSDALIHDSGSFGVEYQYTQKPAMFISMDIDNFKKQLSDFGRQIYDIHYIGKSEGDIRKFIDEVILNEKDFLADKRKGFVRQYLLPPNGMSVAENTMNDLIAALGK